MKAFTVIGFSNSGKTETIAAIIKEITKRGYTVNAVKSVHIDGFTIETTGKDSWRYYQAGAKATAIRADNETTIIYRKTMTAKELIAFFEGDFLVFEGFHEEKRLPKILCAKNKQELQERIDETVFLISGKISQELREYQNIRSINALTNIEELVDVITREAINCSKL
jgi:molybdopterin-guanine dinucleotide biosynthesis protein B